MRQTVKIVLIVVGGEIALCLALALWAYGAFRGGPPEISYSVVSPSGASVAYIISRMGPGGAVGDINYFVVVRERGEAVDFSTPPHDWIWLSDDVQPRKVTWVNEQTIQVQVDPSVHYENVMERPLLGWNVSTKIAKTRAASWPGE